MNILVVDDDAVNRLLLRAIFTAEQMKVVPAVDGVEALAALEREPIDVIVTDILMPKMDGYRLCYEVRTHPRFRHLPLIIYTATYTTPADEQLSLDLGADRFLRKPSPAAVVVDTVRQAVRSPRAILPAIPEAEGIGLMRTYSERLVCKLEERNIALEAAREELRQMNQTLEARVEQRTAELEAANERLESFAYFVSHELRTPLRAVHGFAGILRDDFSAELSPEAQRVVGVIHQGAERMGRLIEDLLNFSRVQRQSLRKQSLEVGDAARAAIEDLRGACASRDVEFVVGAMPRAMGDWALLKQVFANLIGNAVKFTREQPQAKIEVGARGSGWRDVFREGQRHRLRSGRGGQAVQRLRAAASRERLRRQRAGPRPREDDRRAPRRPHVGRGGARPGRDLLFYARPGRARHRAPASAGPTEIVAEKSTGEESAAAAQPTTAR